MSHHSILQSDDGRALLVGDITSIDLAVLESTGFRRVESFEAESEVEAARHFVEWAKAQHPGASVSYVTRPELVRRAVEDLPTPHPRRLS